MNLCWSRHDHSQSKGSDSQAPVSRAMVVREGTVPRCPSQFKIIYGVGKREEWEQSKLCYLHNNTWLPAEIAPA